VLKEANASALVVDTRAELAGLSDAEIDAAAAEAKKRGLDGKFVIVHRQHHRPAAAGGR
jgi:peptidyl-dipeptidase Dcp